MNNRLKVLKWNSILSLCYQVILIATGLVLPRCFLYYYGSEVNGLISSITQFLSFVNICDFGISAVVSSAYYNPLAQKNIHEVSKIFVFSKRYFRIIGVILSGYIICLLVIYPTLINRDFDFWFTFSLIASMGISSLGQYLIGIPYQLLLNSDQKTYVQLIVNGCTLLCNTTASILFMTLGASIQTVKLTTSLIYLLRPIVMRLYVEKHYEIDHHIPVDSTVVPQKKNGIIQHVAYTLYENTDIIVLTFFSTLNNVSIYSVYTLVTNSIRQIITAATAGVQALFGNLIANTEDDELSCFYSFYMWVVHTISSLLFTITGLLIVPFVRIYTSNITDADYYAPVFAVLITFSCYLSSIRNCKYVLIRAAGHYKQTQFAALIEAFLNLTVSIICVHKYGLVGVAIGTAVSTLYFVGFEIMYLSQNIVHMPVRHSLKQICIDFLSALLCIAVSIRINVFADTLWTWIHQAVRVCLVCGSVSLPIEFLFYRKNLIQLRARVARSKHKF